MNYDSEEMRETILRMMTSGYYQYELPRFSKERDSINNALVKIMSEAKRMRFIESTSVLSRAQLDDVTNGIDMLTEGADDAKEWLEYQEMNY